MNDPSEPRDEPETEVQHMNGDEVGAAQPTPPPKNEKRFLIRGIWYTAREMCELSEQFMRDIFSAEPAPRDAMLANLFGKPQHIYCYDDQNQLVSYQELSEATRETRGKGRGPKGKGRGRTK